MARLPLIPEPEVLRSLAARLSEFDYTERRAAEALDIPELGEFFEQNESSYRYSLLRAEPTIADLVRLFLLTDPVPIDAAVSLLGKDVVIGLVKGGAMAVAEEGYVRSRYILSPIDGAFIFTDRRVKGGENRIMPLGHDTYNLVRQTIERPGATVLDLGTGSGVQGVLAARWASRVLSVDINERALDFARMNAHLNGVFDRMEFKLGSLYDPAEGERFDVLLANPPFVPNPEYEVLFRDGGVQGEDILHVIMRDAADHLKEGGLLQIMTEIIYHDDEDSVAKVRHWAGDRLRGVIFEQDDDFLSIYAQEHVYRAYDAEDTNESLARKVEEYQRFLDSVGIHKITHATLHLTLDESDGRGRFEAEDRQPVVMVEVANLAHVTREHVIAAMDAARLIQEPDWPERVLDMGFRFEPDMFVVARWSPSGASPQYPMVEFAEGCPWRKSAISRLATPLMQKMTQVANVRQWLESGLEEFQLPEDEARAAMLAMLGDMVRARWVDLVPR